MTQIKYFIRKDFVGFPVGIVSGEYTNDGTLVRGNHYLPRQLSLKTKCFDTIEDILNYKYCKCGKLNCSFNEELYKIADSLIKNKI